MVYGLLVAIHIIVCIFLVIVVLLQSGKAADLAGAFGGMGSQTAFGPRGSATILSKATQIAAALFMVTSLTLAIMASRGTASVGSTVLDNAPAQKSAPAQSRPGNRPAQTPSRAPAPAPAQQQAPAQGTPQPAPAK
ncbi:MAG TPA: preprotein translocase subunit SecG [Bryobacteraceae bacterium]|nr:preprotein translocase subunit SecG [Bryobacteraceae bacterium]